MKENLFYEKWGSPVGHLFLYSNDTHLLALTFAQNNERVLKQLRFDHFNQGSSKVIEEAISQLTDYFQGTLTQFQIPFRLEGTDFQKSAWNSLKQIPYGQTITYKEQAQRLNNKNALRAIGTAIGRNPISIIVPCHRVIGSNGTLKGYAGGLSAKAKLLEIEKLSTKVG
ncbi:MAG: methylated-DNA--[protein]-cysteine S-methyltransferase [Nitrospirae bacterium]|nr:methylated-DNA--[protein]-cysteine S-methyltransferase [Nitrospirota bacterium]